MVRNKCAPLKVSIAQIYGIAIEITGFFGERLLCSWFYTADGTLFNAVSC